MKYVLTPFVAWAAAGSLKFLINYIRFGKSATGLIGYGGFPSTHTTVLSSTVFLAGLTEGFDTPLFSLGLAVLIVLVIDAHGLRRKVGEQAGLLNKIYPGANLRERMGHSWAEIAGGLALGGLITYIIGGLGTCTP